MPQLDLIIIFPQIFWFFIIFISFYSVLLHYILPKFLIILKSRKLILSLNTKKIVELTNKSIDSRKEIIKYIKNMLTLINQNYKSPLINQNYKSPLKIDTKLILIIKDLVLYYNKYTFDLIKLYHKNLNNK